MKRLLLFSLLCFYVAYAYAADLHFATEATYPPFEYFDDQGQIRGFDIDVANEICHILKRPCKISHQSFSSLIPSLQAGKYDAVIAALGATPERAKEVAFTQAYYIPSASYVAPVAAHLRLKDLPGKKVGVQAGSIFRDYLVHYYRDKMDIKYYVSIQDAFLDLSVGRIDAVLADTPIAADFIKSDDEKKYTIVEHPIKDSEFFGSGYAIAINKNNPQLLKEMNHALSIMKKQGRLQKLLRQYFGVNK